MIQESRKSIISSRLLVLQSKRLILNSLQRRLASCGDGYRKSRIASLCAETETAQHQYRTALLAWGSPEDADYWVVAYARLIEVGNLVTGRLRDANAHLPPVERYQVSADVEMLEHMISRWRATMRDSMAAA